jgi:hypothetical protein
MVSHRSAGRRGLLEWRGLHRPRPIELPTQRRPPGIELVHGHTKVAHRVTDEALVVGSRKGSCWAMCGEFVLVGSLAEPVAGHCERCFA